MTELTSKQRSYLKSLANNLDSIFQVGKQAITPEFTESINEVLEKRELIKLTVLNNCTEDIREIAGTISGRTHSQLVQIIGRKIVLYRESKENPKIELPRVKKAQL